MPFEYKLPDVGEGVAEGELVRWHVAPGDTVEEDQVLAEVETDKALVDVPSPVDGTVRELLVEEGEVVPVGDVLLTIDEAGETAADQTAEDEVSAGEATAEGGTDTEPETGPSAGEGVAAGSESEDETTAAGSESGSGAEAADESATAGGESGGRVFAAPSARRLARELGVDLAAVEGSGPGGRVTENDVRAAAEGGDDGTTAASETGTGAETEPEAATGGDDQSTASGQPEADADEATADVDGVEPTSDDAAAATTVEPADRDRTLAAPATRRVARELGVDVDEVPTDVTRGGEPFVDEAAVREYAEAQKAAQAADAEALAEAETAGEGTADEATAGERAAETAREGTAETASGEAADEGTADTELVPTADEGADRAEERVPYRGVRRTIGEHMETAKYTAPHVTHHDRVDVTALVEAREKLKPRASEQGIRLTYLPFVLKAVVAALEDHPDLNTVLDEENEEIVYKRYYNLGVATATEAGLMVPVVEDVDEKSLLQIASEANELTAKARERTIAREEMQGGTFTVTNFGAIGGEYATPIINYPETAILGLGAIKERPWVHDGEVVPRKVMTLSLSIDHRVIDGAEAAAFTNTLKEYLEDPTLLLLE